jgi:hypothetical protein
VAKILSIPGLLELVVSQLAAWSHLKTAERPWIYAIIGRKIARNQRKA